MKPQDKTSQVADTVSPYEWEHFFVQLKFMLVILKNNHLNIYDPQFYITSLSLKNYLAMLYGMWDLSSLARD